MAPPKLKGLGRGLDALLAANNDDTDAPRGELQTMPAAELQAGKYQPRIFNSDRQRKRRHHQKL